VSNRAGQATAFMAITPIVAGKEDELRAYLDGLSQDESPFALLPRTHFARWVILDDWNDEKSQPKKDHLLSRYLIFTSNFDGDLSSYLDELCDKLAPQAGELWGRCVGCPDGAAGEALKEYLMHNKINTGFFVAAYPHLRVGDVKRALDTRARLIDFAVSSQGMRPAELQSAFNAEFLLTDGSR
jgi:hypothetical protein